MEHLKSASFEYLLTNIKLCLKGAPGTNTLAYYKKSVNYNCNKLYRTGPKTEPALSFQL